MNRGTPPSRPQHCRHSRAAGTRFPRCYSFILLAGWAAWQCAQAQVTPIFTINHPQPTLRNLQGTYFNDTSLTTPVLTRSDGTTFDFNWGLGSPGPGVASDNFSVRWTGTIVPRYSESYTFYSVSDDGIRVWVNDPTNAIIDSWIDQAATEHASSPIDLVAGVSYDLKVEFYEHSGEAVAQLSWSSARQAKAIVGAATTPDGTGDGFGTVLASLGGGRFAVGAPQYDDMGFGSFVGSLILYTDVGHVWYGDSAGALLPSPASPVISAFGLLGTRLTPPNNFGAALATLPDGRLVIGYPGYSFASFRFPRTTHTDVGAVNVITSPGTNEASAWIGNPGSGTDYSYFGHTVAGLAGNWFAASSVEGSGVVYLFDANQPSPVLTTTIPNPNPPIVIITSFPWSGSFGSALAALGTDRLLIGSPNDSVNGDGAGSVFLYNFAGTRLKTVHNFTGRADQFGSAIVAVDDHRFLVGAPAAQVTYTGGGQLHTNVTAGVAYLYDDTGTLLHTFTAGDVSLSGNFGTAMSMLGPDRFLVGSPTEQVGAIAAAGAVHLFGVGGLYLEEIANPTATSGDGFGGAIAAIDERRFVVGAPGDDTLRTDAGSIYGFDAPQPTAELGAAIPQPDGVDTTGNFFAQGPTVTPAGAAYWHVPSHTLYAVNTGPVLVTWPLNNPNNLSPPPVYNWEASATWPTNLARYQIHVAGPTPVDMGGGGVFSNVVLEATTTDADPNSVNSTRVFAAQHPGLSLLMLSPGNPSNGPICFQFVKTIAWNDPAYLLDNAPATIGQPIADPGGYHDRSAGSPQVILPGGVYCPAPVFDPATRTGTIIPVNQDNPALPTDDLVVGFYQRGTLLYNPATGLGVTNSIFWPYQPVRFQPQWPTNAPLIIIASQHGTGAIDPSQFVNWSLYYQNDPGLPGFNPNDEHALVADGGAGQAVFALRDDLGTPQTSEPYVLIRYQDPASGGQWRMKVWQVVAEAPPYFFNYPGLAGTLIQPPFPLSLFPQCAASAGVSGPHWRDRKLSFWAKAAGDDGGPAQIVMRYFYPMQASFYSPGTTPPAPGDCVAWLDQRSGGIPGVPTDIGYSIIWPATAPELRVAETLVKPKFGLPDISLQSSVEILYQQAAALGQGTSVKLIDPTREFAVDLAQLPGDAQIANQNGVTYFPTLPPQLRSRFYYDGTGHKLKFKGQFVQPSAGEYYLLLNVITAREKAILLGLSTDASFQTAVNALSAATANVNEVPSNSAGFDSEALTAGLAQGTGFATLAFGNNPNLSAPAEPISLAIIKVNCPTYQGEIKVIESDNPFDEKLTLRHSGDFAGQADSYIFEWRTRAPVNGLPPVDPPDQWTIFTPDPGTGQGAVDITIQGPGLFTLSDNYFICRYRPVSSPLCTTASNTQGWSDWTAPMLAEGWIKRVLRGINPFNQRFTSYLDTTQINTVVSMISQAGPPFQGNVPLNQQAADQFGLIEAYETILRRGQSLSIDGLPAVNYGPANDALLFAAGRLADLYMLLGNEAYADAADPTIAFGTDDQVYGSQATSIHCFMNQTASLMEEELDLLRGRDDSLLPGVKDQPVYNRLYWNFTSGLDGGEVAYALNYNIRARDGSVSGTISAADAAALYPQGHGDAWGHYLSAIKNYYRLLRNPNFTWVPRIEAVILPGSSVPVSVDYFDERKFAAAAAARARTGAEIVNLTYRNAYVEDPTGQWQGYEDGNTNRAWGLSEWGSRAGQGAYFDWVAGNALLPDVDANPAHTGIQKIDRTTVTELRGVAAALSDIQTKVDQADAGLNPLGLAKNVVPFDIDPTQIAAGKTHFEQIYDRAVAAVNNAITVFNHANNSTQLLRQQSDDVTKFQQGVTDREADFNNRLIEIFGYPYGDDIGPTGAYPTGYRGPDIYHFDYVDESELTGQALAPPQTLNVAMVDLDVDPASGGLKQTPHTVPYSISASGLGLAKPPAWTQSRRAPGQIQMARSDLLQAYTRFLKALEDYSNLIAQIEDRSTLLRVQFNTAGSEIRILNDNLATQEDLNTTISRAKAAQLELGNTAKHFSLVSAAAADALPKVVGLATDATGVLRGIIEMGAEKVVELTDERIAGSQAIEITAQQDKEIASLQQQITITAIKNYEAIVADLQQLQEMVRQESAARLELFNQREALQQFVGRYHAAVATGERLLEDRLRFRQGTAAQIQQYRYKDMAFRIFRNDALQKYRAQFDLAAMYVYLAARAYDYETCLKKGDPRGPGSDFMTGIIRSRSLGLVQNGLPQTGSGSGDPGLADPMARMNLDWSLVLKGQLGFNNPQTETGRFSLRSELFRIQAGSAGSKVWRDTLARNVVADLLTLPEFKRYCISFQPTQPVEPGIVIPFSTSINFGQNFFAWPAGGGDNTYDSTHFATKIRSVGVWFANYNNLNMVNTPHVYLIPVGEDVMRSPSGSVGDIREWKILDQMLPIPFPLSAATLADPNWIPTDISPTGQFQNQLADIRQYAELRAYHDSGNFNPTEVEPKDSRLIGRSVWNTRWLLIIPAGELLSDRNEGLQRFINGSLVNGTRDGNGVTDIKIFFQTYAYSGN